MKIALYTAVFNNKDDIQAPKNYVASSNIVYYVITDNPDFNVHPYKTIFYKPKYKDTTKNAREIKIKGLTEIQDYDTIIWHDANLKIDHSKIEFLASYAEKFPISTFKHPERDCIYEEALACIKYNNDFPSKILFQILLISLLGYPVHAGLYETSILVINQKKYKQLQIGKSWWRWINFLSKRDQLSFPYVIKKQRIIPGILPGNRVTNNFSEFIYHNHYDYQHKKRYIIGKIIMRKLTKLTVCIIKYISYKRHKIH